jgi:hypothetical protein
MAEVAPRQTFARILSLIARLRAAPHADMKGYVRLRRATAGEVRL